MGITPRPTKHGFSGIPVRFLSRLWERRASLEKTLSLIERTPPPFFIMFKTPPTRGWWFSRGSCSSRLFKTSHAKRETPPVGGSISCNYIGNSPSPSTREIILFIGKPIGRSLMISNATDPLKESRKESLLRCAGSTSICEWLVCDLVVMCLQAVGDRAFGDLCVYVRCGLFRVRKYESVVIGFRHQGGSC